MQSLPIEILDKITLLSNNPNAAQVFRSSCYIKKLVKCNALTGFIKYTQSFLRRFYPCKVGADSYLYLSDSAVENFLIFPEKGLKVYIYLNVHKMHTNEFDRDIFYNDERDIEELIDFELCYLEKMLLTSGFDFQVDNYDTLYLYYKNGLYLDNTITYTTLSEKAIQADCIKLDSLALQCHQIHIQSVMKIS